MLKILLVTLCFIFSVCAQNVDSLLAQIYKPLAGPKFHYECCALPLFPFFVLPSMPLIDDNEQCTPGCHCIYSNLVGKNGSCHVIFAGLSYTLYDRIPPVKTYRLFFFVNQDGKWIQEKEPLVVILDLVNKETVQYAPRKYHASNR